MAFGIYADGIPRARTLWAVPMSLAPECLVESQTRVGTQDFECRSLLFGSLRDDSPMCLVQPTDRD